MHVVVIGGGFAGLSAATALAEAGARVTVLEARPALGGRASAFTDPVTGERVDNGQHIVIGGYHETFKFLRRIGADANVRLQKRLAVQIVDASGNSSRLVCPSWPAPLHLLAGVVSWSALDWRDRRAALRIGPALFRRQAAPSQNRASARFDAGTPTVRQWLESIGQTPRLIELLWQPLAVAALNESIDAASASPFREVLRRMFGTSSRDSALGFPTVALDDWYAQPARSFIERRGGEVCTGTPAVLQADGASSSPRVDIASGSRAGVARDQLRPDAAICAVPWYALPALFPSPPPELAGVVDAAARTASSSIVTVNLWLDRRVTRDAFVGLPGRTMQWVFDKSALFEGDSSHLSLVSSAAGDVVPASNAELTELAMRELREALPEARGASLLRAVVVRERRATFSVAPGQPARPGTRTPLRGVFLAGDWIDTGLPATIESAVMSGHWAAAAAQET
jgi:hydroxysqualene dehydroxylase